MSSNLDAAPQLPDGEVKVGQVLGGRYRLNAVRGQRDDITLWDGYDQRLSRDVSIYVLPLNHPRTDALLWAGRQAGAATDPRFLRVLDVVPSGPSDAVSLIVCEDCPSVTLQALLRSGPPLSGLDAAWLVCEVASALAPMHDAGLGHGALSPSTVLVATSGAVRIRGFLLEAALTGRIDHEAAVRERADVVAIGHVLYAALTGMWPDVTTPSPPQTFGLPAAPWRDGALLPPAQVRPGVSPILDAICMQTLQPRAGAAPLRTAGAVALALRRVLGTVDPSDDLAARVNALFAAQKTTQPVRAIPVATPPVENTNRVITGPTGPMPTPAAAVPTPAAAVPTPAATSAPAAPSTTETSTSLRRNNSMTSRYGSPLPQAPTFRRAKLPRWWWIVPAAILVLLLALALRGCFAGTSPPPPSSPEPTVVTITAITELDAIQDGGDGKEHPDQVVLATDGDPGTCWTSEQYSANYIPTSKPGVGLIFDLTNQQSLTTLTITFGTSPVGLSVMVPNDQTVDAPPLDTVQSWASVLDATVDSIPQTVTLPGGTTTRFVMLYFTNVPSIPGNDSRFQVSVCEVTATG